MSGNNNPKFIKEFKRFLSARQSAFMKKAFSTKRIRGYYTGNPPLGYYRMAGNTKDIYPDAKEAEIVREIFTKYYTGNYTLESLADEIKLKGYSTKYGKSFTYNSVYGILRNKAYIGYLTSPKRPYSDIKGRHQPLIPEKLFWAVQKKLRKHKT